MRVKGIEFASGSKTFYLDFETVPVVWYLLIFILCGLRGADTRILVMLSLLTVRMESVKMKLKSRFFHTTS
jgi:hypothetical protein